MHLLKINRIVHYYIIIYVLYTATLKSFSNTQVNTSLWLSAAAYCGSSSYRSHVFKGPTAGFVVTSIIEDLSTDTEGFINLFIFSSSITEPVSVLLV